MFNIKKYIAIAMILGSIVFSGRVMAHTTVLTKNTPGGFETRDNVEGKSSLNHFSVPHGCDGQPVLAQSVVFPNGVNDIAVRTDTNEVVNLADNIEGNAVSGLSPAQNNGIFQSVKKLEGDVPPFTSRGEEVTEDVRAFVYTDGELAPDLLGLLPWGGTYPTFKAESCATKLRVNIGIANYCTDSQSEDDNDRADIWIGRLTDKFDDSDVVSVDFWPFLNVIRDLGDNPISEACGDGYEIVVSPSDESIDEFLPIAGFWPSDEAGNGDEESDDNNDESVKDPDRKTIIDIIKDRLR